MVQPEGGTIEKKLDDQEVKDYLLKVAEAGPMGYLPNSKQTTQMTLNLLREEPADCVLRSTTSETVALKISSPSSLKRMSRS